MQDRPDIHKRIVKVQRLRSVTSLSPSSVSIFRCNSAIETLPDNLFE